MNEPSGRRVPCPRCGTDALFAPSNRWRPFCGERCASIDLGAWASESYRVGVTSSTDVPLPPAGADEAASSSAH